MEAIQTDVLALLVAVLATLIVTIRRPIQEVVALARHVAHHVRHTARILQIILPEDVRDLHVVLLVVPYVKILQIILPEDAQGLHVQVSVRENVPLLVLKHAQVTVPGSAVMDARVIVGAVARTHVQEAVGDNAAYRAVVLAVVNAPLAVRHSASTSLKVVAVAGALEVAA